MTFIYDGSFEGLLTAVFTAFERRQFHAILMTKDAYHQDLFESPIEIIADSEKAKRVQKGITEKTSKQQFLDFWRAFLSESLEVDQMLFRLMIRVFKEPKNFLENYGDDDIQFLSLTLRKVSRERHRMKAFVRFQKSSDGLFVAMIEPDFNVLPLIIPFFKNRYTDQAWLIYDHKRKYGIFYDLKQVTEVTPTLAHVKALQTQNECITLDEKDGLYDQLWKSYFQSTNIEARKNMKLHLRHVPKRYWKYLPEKQGQF